MTQGSGTSTTTPSPLPTWLTDDARVDVSCGSTCDTWVFRIRAKIGIDPAANTTAATPSGLKISNAASAGAPRTFRFWYQLQDSGLDRHDALWVPA